ncbi:hypothetical protein V6N13_100552 [Hibiscus sabdariffa]
MLRLYLCKGFNNLLEQDDKGDVSAETTGPAPAEVSAGTQISAERKYSGPIMIPIEIPFLPRPRISADNLFSADVFSATFQGFNNLLEQDDKGDVSAETTGPATAEVSAGTQISTERLAVLLAYP